MIKFKNSIIHRTNLLRRCDKMFRLWLIRGFVGQKYSNNSQSKNVQFVHDTKCHTKLPSHFTYFEILLGNLLGNCLADLLVGFI